MLLLNEKINEPRDHLCFHYFSKTTLDLRCGFITKLALIQP